jgi:hypothetical protein
MSGPDDFLARWSRRKRAAAEERAEPDEPAQAASDAVEPEPPPAETPTAAEPEFDLASLPPIDSIGPETDIGVFLKPGVPAALRHAALRRAWVADPTIRDFKGLAENDWDFTSPDTPGFGPLGPEYDVKKMVARLFGDDPEPMPSEEATDTPSQTGAEKTASQPQESKATVDAENDAENQASVPTAAPQTLPEGSGENRLLPSEHIAAQHDGAQKPADHSKICRHGGALPQY